MNRIECLEGVRFNYVEMQGKDVTETYVAWMNDPLITRYMESGGGETIGSVRKFVNGLFYNDDAYLFAIIDKENKQHLGNIKIYCSNFFHQRGEVGIMIGNRSYWGKGVATEAIKIITYFGFDVMKLKKISAGCHANNYGSIRAFQKSGYEIEGGLRKNNYFEGGRVDGVVLGVLPD